MTLGEKASQMSDNEIRNLSFTQVKAILNYVAIMEDSSADLQGQLSGLVREMEGLHSQN
eukprot:CAMPEP_0170487860 /NCGR_PEP_ID=MMETSP0208-20121228/6579_1 /TAXON_ID=197538 /ORGANISM="Strombidium inclinatum, Strain S3" /LENGTH=58 /DNA_ID=CAMNT_0010762283 /DNA_START=489 /DNA_END=665 /DNA_ORIENTATION=+